MKPILAFALAALCLAACQSAPSTPIASSPTGTTAPSVSPEPTASPTNGTMPTQ
jgi:hypothetical protein